jgi:hypothetical protein
VAGVGARPRQIRSARLEKREVDHDIDIDEFVCRLDDHRRFADTAHEIGDRHTGMVRVNRTSQRKRRIRGNGATHRAAHPTTCTEYTHTNRHNSAQ